MHRIDLTGQTFGELVVECSTMRGVNSIWLCRCSCGRTHEVMTGELRKGKTKSCGCFRRRHTLIHGDNRKGHRTKEYRVWSHIVARCHSPTDRAYAAYGGRGIVVCEAWLSSFATFLADMGRAPSPRHSIDRIDNDGPYSPTNCRWATPPEQSRNTRRNIMVGDLCLKDACVAAGVSYGAAQARIRRGGQSPSEAINALRMIAAINPEGKDE